ncbi:MAG: tetratricopeptide repeat protein [Pelagibacteraceae bacterium]
MIKNIIYIISFSLITQLAYSAGDGNGSASENSYYDDAVKLVKRAGKLEKKNKPEKAKKLYSEAFKKLNKSYKSDKKNPDILNYMGFTSRKIGKFEEAEDYYLKGLSLSPKHNGINEYLGELYVQTNRIDKANERLAVLKNCNCDEYQDLELIIKTKGTKIY